MQAGAIASGQLRSVHGLIGESDESLDALVSARSRVSDPRADCQSDVSVRRFEAASFDLFTNSLRNHFRLFCGAVRQKHDELFTAVATQDIGAPQMAPCDMGHVPEYIVTHLMTPSVVDLLEMVEIEKHHADWMAVANGYGECVSGKGEEMATVVDAGQFIRARVLLFARKGFLQLSVE